MGRPKQSLRLADGRMMIEAVAAALSEVCPEVVIVGDAEGLPLVSRIADLRSGRGPLGGIEAALASGRGDAYLVCPCDLPLLRPDMLRQLLDGRALVRVLRLEDRSEYDPLPLRIDAAALPLVRSLLDDGQGALWRLLATIDPEVVSVPAMWADSLSNVNTPEDWERLQQMIADRRDE